MNGHPSLPRDRLEQDFRARGPTVLVEVLDHFDYRYRELFRWLGAKAGDVAESEVRDWHALDRIWDRLENLRRQYPGRDWRWWDVPAWRAACSGGLPYPKDHGRHEPCRCAYCRMRPKR